MNDVEDLIAENTALRKRVQELQFQTAWFDRHAKAIAGALGEQLIAELLLAQRVFGNKPHDLETRTAERLEIKFSNLQVKPARRWVWNKIHGTGGKKAYDRLLLVGNTKQDRISLDTNPETDLVIFSLTGADARELAPKNYLRVNANQDRAEQCAAGKRLYQHKVSIAELQERYGA